VVVQKAVLADDVFRLLVIGQQLVNQCLVYGIGSILLFDGRLHSPLHPLFGRRLSFRTVMNRSYLNEM